MKFGVKSDLRQVTQFLNDIERKQLPFATALALTNTAKAVEAAELREIDNVFDRPTNYTRKSLYVRPATKSRLVAEVGVKDFASNARPPIKWLIAQIAGGPRALKGIESQLQRVGRMPPGALLVPAAGMPRDSFGNVNRGMLQRLISDLKAQRFDVYANTTATSAKRRLRSRTRRASFFFSTWPVTKSTAHLTPGIYQRSHFGFGTAIKPAFIFVDRAYYAKRFDFHGIAQRVSSQEWPRQFQVALAHALATAR